MSNFDVTKAKLKAKLAEYEAELDIQRARASRKMAEASEEGNKQLDAAAERVEQAKEQLATLTEETWKDIEGQVTSLWDDVKDAVQSLKK